MSNLKASACTNNINSNKIIDSKLNIDDNSCSKATPIIKENITNNIKQNPNIPKIVNVNNYNNLSNNNANTNVSSSHKFNSSCKIKIISNATSSDGKLIEIKQNAISNKPLSSTLVTKYKTPVIYPKQYNNDIVKSKIKESKDLLKKALDDNIEVSYTKNKYIVNESNKIEEKAYSNIIVSNI